MHLHLLIHFQGACGQSIGSNYFQLIECGHVYTLSIAYNMQLWHFIAHALITIPLALSTSNPWHVLMYIYFQLASTIEPMRCSHSIRMYMTSLHLAIITFFAFLPFPPFLPSPLQSSQCIPNYERVPSIFHALVTIPLAPSTPIQIDKMRCYP